MCLLAAHLLQCRSSLCLHTWSGLLQYIYVSNGSERRPEVIFNGRRLLPSPSLLRPPPFWLYSLSPCCIWRRPVEIFLELLIHISALSRMETKFGHIRIINLFSHEGIFALWYHLHWALYQEYLNIRFLNNLIVLTEFFPTPNLLDWGIPIYIYIYIYIYISVGPYLLYQAEVSALISVILLLLLFIANAQCVSLILQP